MGTNYSEFDWFAPKDGTAVLKGLSPEESWIAVRVSHSARDIFERSENRSHVTRGGDRGYTGLVRGWDACLSIDPERTVEIRELSAV